MSTSTTAPPRSPTPDTNTCSTRHKDGGTRNSKMHELGTDPGCTPRYLHLLQVSPLQASTHTLPHSLTQNKYTPLTLTHSLNTRTHTHSHKNPHVSPFPLTWLPVSPRNAMLVPLLLRQCPTHSACPMPSTALIKSCRHSPTSPPSPTAPKRAPLRLKRTAAGLPQCGVLTASWDEVRRLEEEEEGLLLEDEEDCVWFVCLCVSGGGGGGEG